MGLRLAMLMLTAALTAAPGDASAEPRMSRRGAWSFEVAEQSRCLATLCLPQGGQLMLLGEGGELGFGTAAREPIVPGSRGRLQMDTGVFDFSPSYEGAIVFLDGHMDAGSVAVLRKARLVRITVNGREIMSVSVAGTGLTDVVPALLECSKGRRGWWGEGASRRAGPHPRHCSGAHPSPAPAPGRPGWSPSPGGSGLSIRPARPRG